MEIKQLRYFLAASESQSFSLAAQKFYTTRQVVSYSIKSLEKEFGIVLFNRRNNKLAFTDAGREFARRAKQLIRAIDDFERDFAGYTGNGSTKIRVAIDPANVSVRGSIIDAIFSYFESQQGIELVFTEASSKACFDRLMQRSVDVGVFRCMPRVFPECETTMLKTSAFRLLMNESNPLSSKASLDVSDVADQSFVFPRGYTFSYHAFLEKCERNGFQCRVKNIIDDVLLALVAVKNNDCVLIAGTEEDVDDLDGLVAVPFSDDDLFWGEYLVYRKDYGRKNLMEGMTGYLSSFKF